MPKNFFSISKDKIAVLTTLVVLIMLGCVYFFIYLPANEKTIQAQRFRALQNTDRNIQAKIENSAALLNTLLTEYQKGGKRIDSLNEYIKGYPRENFTLLEPGLLPKGKRIEGIESADSACSITVNNNTRQITLLLIKQKEEAKDTVRCQAGMVFTFKQFIQFLLPDNIFDQYIVFSDNKPVFETFPSGISYAKKDSLLDVRKGIRGSLILDQNISGTDYKMFLHPAALTEGNEWIICGLLSNARYQHEKNQLPTTIILFLVTVLLIITVSFPWIKLFQMGSKDRLTVTDGIFTLFISMLLMSLLFFIVFKYNFPLRSKEITDPKKLLAGNIGQAFKNEIDSAYKKLASLDTLQVNSNGALQKNVVNLNKNTVSFSKQETGLSSLPEKINSICQGLSINHAFWLDSTGLELINWTAEKANAPHGRFANREYFKHIMEGQPYLLDNNAEKKYYLDQVTSWTSGSFTSVIAIPSGLRDTSGATVAALSVNIKSLDSAILPAGYLFAIIDAEGRVLYHSDKSKNLNENLLDEFSGRSDLQSSIQAKTESVFSTNYFGEEYNVLVKPLAGFPYYIVVFSDTVFKETSEAEIYSFTIFMLLIFFGVLVAQLLVVFIVSARQSAFKNQRFDTTWIGPRISCRNEYVLSAVFNIINIIALFLSFSYCSFLQYFFIMLISVTMIPFFLNGIFAIRYHQEKRNVLQYKKTAILWLGILIIIINAAAVILLSDGHYGFVLLYQAGLFALSAAIYYSKEKILDAGKALQSGNGPFKKWNYVNSFAFMAVTRLVVTSGIPIVFFYYSSYNYEQNLSVRYSQADFLNKIKNIIPSREIDTIFKDDKLPPGIYADGKRISGISVINDPNVHPAKDSKEDTNTLACLRLFRMNVNNIAVKEEKFYMQQSSDSTLFFNNMLQEACTAGNGTISYLRLAPKGSYLQAKSADLNYHFPKLFTLNGKQFIKSALFWFFLLILLAVFYFLLCSIIKKLFALHLPDMSDWKELDNKILTEVKLNQLIFVIGLPGAGKKSYILDKLVSGKAKEHDQNRPFVYIENDDANSNVFIADLIHIPDSSNDEEDKKRWEKYVKRVTDKKNKLIIVNHFEYNIQDPQTNRSKLNFLERLMLDENSKIIILSSIHPVAFLDSAISPSVKKENITAEHAPGEDLERWHVLLGHYRIIMMALEPIDSAEIISGNESAVSGLLLDTKDKPIPNATVSVKNTTDKTSTDAGGNFNIITIHKLPFTLIITAPGYVTEEVTVKDDNEVITIIMEETFYNWKDRIRSETHYTHFLNKMQHPAIGITSGLPLAERMTKSDELAFKLQVTSHYFYMYIWQSLTKEEKFLLYDLAEDNLVNSYDNYNLCMLIGKGVIIQKDGTLKLFNSGFRNFILTAIGNTEAMKIKNQMKDNGNWSKLKNPMLMVILAILAFLLTSQEESYSKIITYLAALGAGVPTVLKIFSLFEKQNDKAG